MLGAYDENNFGTDPYRVGSDNTPSLLDVKKRCFKPLSTLDWPPHALNIDTFSASHTG